MDQQLIKRQNRRAMLEVLRRKGSLSRAELAREVGLTKSTISALTQELLDEKLVIEGTVQSTGLGRPGISLELCSEGALALGVELGVDSTQMILLDMANQAQGQWEWVESPDTPLSDRLKKIVHQIKTKVPAYEALLGIGLSFPGVVRDDQSLNYAPGPGWRNEHPAEVLQTLLELPVIVENDANASALSETFWGESHSPLAYIILHSGLGTGLIVNGQVFRGRFGAAGELGHWKSNSEHRCTCGRMGCLENELSIRALVAHYQALSKRNEGFWGILKMAEHNDAHALSSLEALGAQLGRFVANLAVTFDPAIVVLGGTGAEAWQWLEPPMRQRLAELAFIPEHATLPIRPSAFGHLAPVMGAAALVLQRFLESGGTRELKNLAATRGLAQRSV